ncbi:hypothetical protein BDP81DRAFT_125752 [Colletotrichum phormii]|uniref:Uncharacterized protein n=1 Tax=Colletotrichum phormii TaxID=359342 RepID=A0AAI9ZZD8_9PEZI|nr:uncharacterized protein BDP81DRAFT_125752 [Colletotrichum phormii]KAK1640993.1 hypothetical protein BDP81DRAFT_125752 [Colletotrichum phormii]
MGSPNPPYSGNTLRSTTSQLQIPTYGNTGFRIETEHVFGPIPLSGVTPHLIFHLTLPPLLSPSLPSRSDRYLQYPVSHVRV